MAQVWKREPLIVLISQKQGNKKSWLKLPAGGVDIEHQEQSDHKTESVSGTRGHWRLGMMLGILQVQMTASQVGLSINMSSKLP